MQTTDAQGAVGTATFEVNVTGANDAPVITAASGDSAGATVSETNAALDETGTLTLSDLDTTDHVSVARNDHVGVYLQGDLKADGFEGLWASDLLNYFTVPSAEILNGTANHAQFTWEFNSGSQAFDFLAAGQTLSLQYTIVPSDGHTATGTGNGVVTINISGTNDAPTLDSTTLASVTGNESNPGGATIVSLFTDKFHDVDTGASFTAVAVTSDTASARRASGGTSSTAPINGSTSVWSTTRAHSVLSTDTLIRFRAGRWLHRDAGCAGRACPRRHLYRCNHRIPRRPRRSILRRRAPRHDACFARPHQYRYESDAPPNNARSKPSFQLAQ